LLLITIKSTIAHYHGASEQISDTAENRNEMRAISWLFTGVDQLIKQSKYPQPTTAYRLWRRIVDMAASGKPATTRVNDCSCPSNWLAITPSRQRRNGGGDEESVGVGDGQRTPADSPSVHAEAHEQQHTGHDRRP